jgi:hypothetical protein
MMTLTDSNRLRIIRALLGSRRNVGEIAKITGLNIHRVSHHHWYNASGWFSGTEPARA